MGDRNFTIPPGSTFPDQEAVIDGIVAQFVDFNPIEKEWAKSDMPISSLVSCTPETASLFHTEAVSFEMKDAERLAVLLFLSVAKVEAGDFRIDGYTIEVDHKNWTLVFRQAEEGVLLRQKASS